MKLRLHLPALLLATSFVYVSLAANAVPALAAPRMAVCVVCQEGEEEVKATAIHAGKEYLFCSDGCKETFLKDPQAFIKATGPRTAPRFNLKTLNGQTVTLADLKGKVVLASFWATFNAAGVKAMPKLQKLHEKYGARGFTVVGIATDEDTSKVGPTVAKAKVQYPILLDNAGVWRQYGVTALPALFLINREGQIVHQFDHKAAPAQIEKEVERFLGSEVQR